MTRAAVPIPAGEMPKAFPLRVAGACAILALVGIVDGASAAPRPLTPRASVNIECRYYGVVITAGLIARSHGGNVRTRTARELWARLIREALSVRTGIEAVPRLHGLDAPYEHLLATLELARQALQGHDYPLYRTRVAALVPELTRLGIAERQARLLCKRNASGGTVTIGPG